MQLVLTIDEGPFLDHKQAKISRLLHWIRSGQSLIVGRDRRRSEVTIEVDSRMSGAHFQVTCEAHGCRLRDLGSRHGTFVNGLRVTETELHEGDYILAGQTRFRVQIMKSGSVSLPLSARDTGPVERPTMATAARERMRPAAPLAPARDIPPAASAGGAAELERMQVVLQIIEGPWGEGKYASLDRLLTWIRPGEVVKVGRSATRADMAIHRDHQMSAVHFELSCDGKVCRMRDLESTNGTFLNGQRVQGALLRDGDEIRAGRTHFVVRMEGGQPIDDDEFQQAVVLSPAVRTGTTGPVPDTSTYRIINTTPFPLALLVGQIDYPHHSLTLIVKGTFQLRPGEKAVPADEQQYATGDLPYPDDPESSRPPRYESDFGFFKPRADVLVVGHCHAPSGKPARQVTASVRVGGRTRSLDVFGTRLWQRTGKQWSVGEPELFSQLELRYEASFGGDGFEPNPQGLGYRAAPLASAEPWKLPHIEDPEARVTSPDDRAEPAGFGPRAKWQGLRRTLLGTYDTAWQRERWPWYPADFSYDHFNAAAPAFQVDGYLRGDEELQFRNMHPEHSDYRSRLPAVRVRCFVNPLGREFREVAMHLDTLWVDMDGELAVLVWRGHTEVASDDCQDLRHVFVLSQALNETPLSLAECHARLLEELSQRDGEFQPPPQVPEELPDDGEAEMEPSAAGSSTVRDTATETAAQEVTRQFERELAELKARVRDAQIASGVDPAQFDAQVRAEEARLIQEWGLGGDIPPPDLEQRIESELGRVRSQVREAQLAAGIDPQLVLPEETPPEPAAGAGMGPGPGPGMGPGPTLGAETWTRQRVVEHHAAGGSFVGENLEQLDLSGLDLRGADFSTAILTGCQFVGSRLQRCNFTLANLAGVGLSGADLQEATLDHADLSGAELIQARLEKVHAHFTVFAAANLMGATLHLADAQGASFTEADLSAANMTSGQFDQANFTRAKLEGADARLSSLVEAEMRGVSARQAKFDEAKMTRLRAGSSDFAEARLVQVQARDAIWEKARLDRVDLTRADLTGVNFIQASLEQAQLSASNLSGARLSRARLVQATLSDAKLFEADLQRADLSRADLRKSNLYGSELLGAVWTEARCEGVNWRGTKRENHHD